MKAITAAAAFLALVCCAGRAASAGVNDKVYAALSGDGGVAVIDPQTLDAWGTIRTGKMSSKLKASPDGRFVYVTVSGENKVKRIDTSADRVTGEVETGDTPWGMDLTPDGKLLLVGNDRGRSLSIIQTGPFKELKRVGLGGMPQAVRVSPSGKRAYIKVEDPENELVVMDLKTMRPASRLKIPGRAYNMEVSPGGNRLYVHSLDARKVLVVDTSTMKVVGGVDAYESGGFALTKDGKEVWYVGPEGKLTAYSVKNGKAVAEMPCGCPDAVLAFSPDGKQAFAGPAGEGSAAINVYDTAGKKKTGEIALPGIPRDIVFIGK